MMLRDLRAEKKVAAIQEVPNGVRFNNGDNDQFRSKKDG